MKLKCEFVNKGLIRGLLCTACAFMVIAGACLGAEPAATGVKVATGSSIQPGNAELVLHVAPDGNDAGTGDAAAPLKTIGQAVKIAAKESDLGKAVRIAVHPGVYREEVRIPRHTSETPGMLSIEAETPGKAVLSGSDVWQDGWSLSLIHI